MLAGGAGVAALALAGCSGSDPSGGEPDRRATTRPADSGRPNRVLLAYFSRNGENYADGGRVDLEVGNTAVLAGILAGLVDVDLFEITASDPYPHSYDETVARNVREQDNDARPVITGTLPDPSAHDTVLLGSPVWNVRAPMILRTFVDSVDLSGRTVLPFVTYAVSGLGRVGDEYAQLLPDSRVGEGLAVRGEEVARARPAAEDWLRRVGLLA